MQKGTEINSYRDLFVWQKAMDLMVICYKLVEKLPPHEKYGLVSEIRRSAMHVPAHIADGKGREYLNEYLQKLSAAHGSLMYLETNLQAIDRLQYLPMEEITPALNLSAEVGKMLQKLIGRLRGDRS